MTAVPPAPGVPRPVWQRSFKNRGFLFVAAGAATFSCVALAVLITSLLVQGAARLGGFDAEARDAAMAPQPVLDLAELDRVDWPEAAARLEMPFLADLDRVDFAARVVPGEIEFSDEAGKLDWRAIAAEKGLADGAALAAADWTALANDVTMPGAGRIRATLGATAIGRFVTSPPSRSAERAGIGPALAGTAWICGVCALLALPLGVGTAIFLEEYRPHGRLARRIHGVIQLNIANLAGVPSIVYGIIGLTAFVQMWSLSPSTPSWTIGTPERWYYLQVPFGRGVLAGGMTLMLVILPIVIIATQEAIRAVPDSLRQGSLALGATRWQTIRGMTLPAAIPGIMTGSILAMSRAIGEAAPVLIICGIVFVRFLPQHLMDEFTALPLQIYDWAGRPQEDFHAVAAAGILVLLAALLAFNAVAIFIRHRFQKPLQ